MAKGLLRTNKTEGVPEPMQGIKVTGSGTTDLPKKKARITRFWGGSESLFEVPEAAHLKRKRSANPRSISHVRLIKEGKRMPSWAKKEKNGKQSPLSPRDHSVLRK